MKRMVLPCRNRKRQDTGIISSVPKGLAHFAREFQVREMAGNIMTADYSIIANKERSTITIIEGATGCFPTIRIPASLHLK